MIPAVKSCPIDTFAMTPKITIGRDGGMIGPMVEEAAVMPTEKSVLIAVIPHCLDLDGAETARIGDRRAGHAGEDHRADRHSHAPARRAASLLPPWRNRRCGW